MSDREKDGLRGPVKTSITENTHVQATTVDGVVIPESKTYHTLEYSEDGRRIASRFGNSAGSEWRILYTYDLSGNLLKTTSRDAEGATTETYSYDELGRLSKVVNSRKPDSPVTFRYDDRGRKTKVQISRPEDYRPNVASGGTPFQASDRAPNLLGGGSATTMYDENDRPTEVLIHDAAGELVSRALCTYDAQGRILEECQIFDNPETIFPSDVLAEIIKSGHTREQLRLELKKLMGGEDALSSICYEYHAEGRVCRMHRRVYSHKDIIETTYNQNGDKEAEITRSETIATPGQNVPSAGPQRYIEVLYSYQYDSYGNWTEEITSNRFEQDGKFQASKPRLRKLTYY